MTAAAYQLILDRRLGDYRLPEAVDLQYGVAAALVRRALRACDAAEGRDVCGNILRYAQRFPQREMGVMLVTDMQRSIGHPLIDLPAFQGWADSIGELLLFERQTG